MSVELKVAKNVSVIVKGAVKKLDDVFTLEDYEVDASVIELVTLEYLEVQSGALPSAEEGSSTIDADPVGKELVAYIKSKATQIRFVQEESGGFHEIDGTAFVGQVEIADVDGDLVPLTEGEVTVAVQSGTATIDTDQPVTIKNGVATFEATVTETVGQDVILELSSPTPSGLAVTDTLTIRRAS